MSHGTLSQAVEVSGQVVGVEDEGRFRQGGKERLGRNMAFCKKPVEITGKTQVSREVPITEGACRPLLCVPWANLNLVV